MVSRRGFIRIGAATVGSLALRPFGLLPALARERTGLSGAGVRVPVRRQRFEQHRDPDGQRELQRLQSIRGSLALTGGNLTPVTSVSGAPYAFHAKLAEVASLFSSKELAVVANIGPLVQPLTRAQYQSQQAAIPLNLFSHADQQLAWQTSIAQGNSPTGWAGRAADYIAAQRHQFVQLPDVFLGGRQRARRGRRDHPAGGAGAGTIAAVDGIQQLGGIAGAA